MWVILKLLKGGNPITDWSRHTTRYKRHGYAAHVAGKIAHTHLYDSVVVVHESKVREFLGLQEEV